MVSHTMAIKCVSAELTVLIEPLMSTSASCPLVGLNVEPDYSAKPAEMEFKCVEPSNDLKLPLHFPDAHPKSYPIIIPCLS